MKRVGNHSDHEEEVDGVSGSRAGLVSVQGGDGGDGGGAGGEVTDAIVKKNTKTQQENQVIETGHPLQQIETFKLPATIHSSHSSRPFIVHK